jgi:Tol biopolymer transport system component
LTWPTDDTIVFASQDTMIWKVTSGGGKPERLTTRGNAGDDARHLLPQMLPGGKWLLFTAQPTVFDWEHTRVVAQSLETGERKVVLEDAADARYVPTGHLVFMRQGNLMAAPFDVNGVRLTGSETGMVEGVMQSINAVSVPLDTGAGQFAFSSTGTLVYVAGAVHPDFEGTLQWIDRSGKIEQIPASPRAYALPRLSPDGQHLVVTTFGIHDHSLWRYDFATHTLLRLTTEGHVAWPFWSPDGTQIAFGLAITGPFNLFLIGADGGVAPRRLGQSPVTQFSGSWTPDGQSIVYDEDRKPRHQDHPGTWRAQGAAAHRHSFQRADARALTRWSMDRVCV